MATLDLQRLRCFVAVAEERHFARAAARLNLTPPPLSRQIKQLERELGSELFVRGYHNVELTPFGEALLDPVREAIGSVDALADFVDELNGLSNPLRIGATPFAPTPFLDHFLATVREGGITVQDEVQLEYTSSELARRVAGGSLDLALIHLPSPDESLSGLPWHEYRLAIAMRHDDELAQEPTLTLDRLRGCKVVHPLGKLHPKLRDEHRQQLEQVGIEALDGPVGAAEIATQVWSMHLAAFVPDLPWTLLNRVFAPPEFVTIPVVDGLMMHLGVVWSPTCRVSPPAMRRALERLREAVAPAP